MDCNKIFQAPLSDPKGEADALTHSKKSLFQIYMYSKPLEFFFHQLLFFFFSSPSFSNVLRSPACGYALIINATDIKQPHRALNETDLTLGKHGKGQEVSTQNKPGT